MKLRIGQEMPDFKYNTAFVQDVDYLQNIKNKISVLLFLRYYGCTICQLDLMKIQNNISKFKEHKIDIKVVLQSSIENMRRNLQSQPLDYDIICDPLGKLYKKFDINVANSKISLGGGNTIKKVQRAKKAGFTHGEYEGEELQLPAVFIIDQSGKIIYSHYGANAADIPSTEEILNIIV